MPHQRPAENLLEDSSERQQTQLNIFPAAEGSQGRAMPAWPGLGAAQGGRLVLVASKNPAKINAAHAAYRACFPRGPMDIRGVGSSSGVPDQPVGDEETLQGALNRLKCLRASLKLPAAVTDSASLWETGSSSSSSSSSSEDSSEGTLLVALEGGVLWRGPSELYCFAYAVAQMVSPDGGAGRISQARSAEFMLPAKIAELVAGGMELGAADDQVFNRVQSGQGTGTIGYLTGGLITRQLYYEHAAMLSLIPFMNPELYPEYCP